MLQSQLRQAKLLSPRSPHVRLLERQYQSHLRHSRDSFAQRGVLEFSQLFKSNPRKFWQMVRLPSMLLPEELRDTAAWDTFLDKLTSSPHSMRLSCQLLTQHSLLCLPTASISLLPWLRWMLACNSFTMADQAPYMATLQSCCAMPSWFPRMQTLPQCTSCCLV